MAFISLKNVGVTFPVHNADSISFQLHLFNRLGGEVASHRRAVMVRALAGIDLELKDGDRLGLIGHNGAGKTTLLRVLSGVYDPTQGELEISGQISSFTDIALGMDPEATGLENIIFRSVFLGMTFEEARANAAAIAEFSELGDYLQLPVRTYSSGMFVRLAFAISTAIRPEIMIMDEMISAGDSAFMVKAQARINELLSQANILIIASHDPNILRSFCNRVAWLEHGRIREIGGVEEVMVNYRDSVVAAAAKAHS